MFSWLKFYLTISGLSLTVQMFEFLLTVAGNLKFVKVCNVNLVTVSVDISSPISRGFHLIFVTSCLCRL